MALVNLDRMEEGVKHLWLSQTELKDPELSGPMIHEGILDLVDAHLPEDYRGKRNCVWMGDRSGAYAHIIADTFWLTNAYRHEYDHLVIIGPDRHKYLKYSAGTFDIVTRGFTYIETDDQLLIDLATVDYGRFHRGSNTYLFITSNALHDDYFVRRFRPDNFYGEKNIYLNLNTEEITRGEILAKRNGVDLSRPLVVIHAREHGYHGLQKQAFRNVNIDHYLETIQYLIASGYMVVRIGDKNSTPLPDMGPCLVDVPFSPEYHPFLDVFVIHRCEFMITSHSGPCWLARAMGRPCLTVNAFVTHHVSPTNFELWTFKKYVETESGRERLLGFEEILDRQLYRLLYAEDFNSRGIRLEELSSKEILAVTQEMIQRLKSLAGSGNPFQDRFYYLMFKEFVRYARQGKSGRKEPAYFNLILPRE